MKQVQTESGWNLNATAWVTLTNRDSWENRRWNPWKRETNRASTSICV